MFAAEAVQSVSVRQAVIRGARGHVQWHQVVRNVQTIQLILGPLSFNSKKKKKEGSAVNEDLTVWVWLSTFLRK